VLKTHASGMNQHHNESNKTLWSLTQTNWRYVVGRFATKAQHGTEGHINTFGAPKAREWQVGDL